jgi:hypothetical protein
MKYAQDWYVVDLNTPGNVLCIIYTKFLLSLTVS